MRLRRFVTAACAVVGFGSVAVITTGCADPLPTVVDVAKESATPLSQALALYGYQPVVPVYDDYGEHQIGTIYVICGPEYSGDVSECSDHYRTLASNDYPVVWTEKGKVTRLIGERRDAWRRHSNFKVTVPSRPVPPPSMNTSASPSPSPLPSGPAPTWQDFERLTHEQQMQLLASVAAASPKCCGNLLGANVEVDGLGQVWASW
jgi:hypothetical protein